MVYGTQITIVFMGCWGASHCKNNPLSSRKPPENRQVYARTGKTSRDVSLFLVEKGTKGFSLGQKIEAWPRACGIPKNRDVLFFLTK